MLCKTRDLASGLLLVVLAAHPAFGQSYGGPNAGQDGNLAGTGLNPPLPMLAGARNQGVPPASPMSNGGAYSTQQPANGYGYGTQAGNGCGCGTQTTAGCCNPYEDHNGPLLCGDPLLDAPPWAPPGWFGALEADLVGTHIKNRLTDSVTVGGVTDNIHLPTADLDWTVSPRIELGYRFCEGAGELLIAFKFLTTSGTESVPNFDPNSDSGDLHSRLNINVLDLDYGSREISLWPCWDFKWRAGVRFEGIYFDSTATSPLLQEHVSNDFYGAGPHVGLDLRRFIHGTGLEFTTRVESAFVIGQTYQTADESEFGIGSGSSRVSDTLISPWLGVQAGVSWTPPCCKCVTVSAGYTFEAWWSMADIGSSRGDITSEGVFFRGEWRY